MEFVPESPSSFYISFGLNNLVAQETRVEIKPTGSPDDSLMSSNSPTERLKNQVWPALKKGISNSLAEGTKIPRKRHDNQPSNAVLPSVTFQPKQLKKAASGSLSERRDIALAELGIIPMPLGLGPRMDSPTIPGRIPVHGRSNSAPGSSANQTPFARSIQEPISEPLILFSKTDLDIKKSLAKIEELQDTPGSQSAPESVPPCDLKETSFLSNNEVSEVQEEDKPPAVPPKSPRLINRAMMPLPNIVEARLIAPKASDSSLRPRASTAIEIRPRRHIVELHRRNESTPVATVSKIQISKPSQRMAKLKHEAGESALQSQDRSKRRRSLLGAGVRTSKSFVVTEKTKFTQLPVGFNLPDAKSQFTSSDVEKLRDQAQTQAEKFKVLQYQEVKSLSKELRYLDARCDYLQTTTKALRARRNRLHERVIAELRSSRSASISRQNILEQEEALGQLDKSIDEWIAKLERVDNRRTRVRQMLLEHIAASLILSASYENLSSKQDVPAIQNEVEVEVSALDIQFDEVASVARESIKIYADYGVYGDGEMADLLADIERQMETMTGSRRPPSFSEHSIVA
ncbi:hypothetical protein TMatcc_005158 [Talaromyces marneffei ATCC 18224]